MKTSLIVLGLLLFAHASAFPEPKTESAAGYRAAPLASLFQPQGTTVNVYFVSGVFTAEQRQILLRTLELWTPKQEATSTINFLYVGETGGLIDCVGCLTLTRQETYTNDPKRLVSFNSLRGDHQGKWISAWIGFDREVMDPQKLRSLLVRMLNESKAFDYMKKELKKVIS